MNKRDVQPVVIRKTEEFIFFKIGHLHLLDTVNFVRRAPSQDCFWKVHKKRQRNQTLPHELSG